MTDIQTYLDLLGWSTYHAAEKLGVSRSTVRCWAVGVNARGNVSIAPEWVADYLRRCATAVAREPLHRAA